MGSTKGIRALNKEPIEEYMGSKKGKWNPFTGWERSRKLLLLLRVGEW
jgi:hypothetical protein